MSLKNYYLQFITQKQEQEKLVLQVEKMCKKGVKWVQYRRKERVTNEIKKDEVFAIKAICNLYNCTLIINDDIALAKITDADGVHLGKKDTSPMIARKTLGDKKIIGGTANTLKDILTLCKYGVDYIGLGPYRYTATKEKLSPILGLSGVSKVFDELKKYDISVPIVLVGGIKESDIMSLSHTKADGVAISSSLIHNNNAEKYVKCIYDNFYKKNKL